MQAATACHRLIRARALRRLPQRHIQKFDLFVGELVAVLAIRPVAIAFPIVLNYRNSHGGNLCYVSAESAATSCSRYVVVPLRVR